MSSAYCESFNCSFDLGKVIPLILSVVLSFVEHTTKVRLHTTTHWCLLKLNNKCQSAPSLTLTVTGESVVKSVCLHLKTYQEVF